MATRIVAMLALVLSVVVMLPEPVFADEPSKEDVAKAREEYRRGLALEGAGDYDGALKVYKSVALVKSTPQVRYHVAVCEEKVGDWIGALGSYRLALADAQDAKVKEVEKESKAAIAQLEPKIPKITITRGSGATTAVVVLDGQELGPASIGIA